jgi:hypothetical protein
MILLKNALEPTNQGEASKRKLQPQERRKLAYELWNKVTSITKEGTSK